MAKIRTTMLFGVAACAALIVSSAEAGIADPGHDFSGWGSPQRHPCEACHTPRNADGGVASAPLWDCAATQVSSHTLYSSPTLNASLSQPTGVSRICLSCHEGAIAYDSFSRATGGAVIGGGKRPGIDLSASHPVSFIYDTSLAVEDGELRDPASTNSGLGGTIQEDLLFADSMECTSCHDVHAGNGKLLRLDNRDSALCLTCHAK
jgi:predicted CXXCH cytochrome family protein